MFKKAPLSKIDPENNQMINSIAEKNLIKVTVDDGINLIRHLIHTHIPFGPFQGNYFFIKRDIVKEKN